MPNCKTTGTVTGSYLSKTSTGKDQIIINFRTPEGEFPYRSMLETDKNLEFLEKALVALGWNPNENGWDITLLNGTDVLVGQEAPVTLEESTYNGRTMTNVKFIGGGGGKPMEDTEAMGLVARIQKMRGINPSQIPF